MVDANEMNDVLRPGTDVYGSDDEKLGSIVAVQHDHVVVEKGFFFPTDYYIPISAISSYDNDRVYLDVTKENALNQQWTTAPVSAETGYAADTGVQTNAMPSDHSADTTTTGYAGATTGDTVATETDSTTIQVHEEELIAQKRQTDLGEVRIEKDVVQEEQVLDVPVTEERVRVERRTVDRAAGPGEDAFEETSIDVPVHGEEVELSTRSRVTEEIEIDKEAVQRTERVGGTVRREEVRVEDSTTTGNATVAGDVRDSKR